MVDSILLVRPYAIGKKEFPLGLLYVGTSLKNKGYDVEIVDLHDNPQMEDEVIDILSRSPRTLLGISALVLHYHWVKKFTLKVKEKSPHTPIVIGGHIVPAYEILLNKTGVDYVCMGEGEEALFEIIEKLNNNQPVVDVPGFAYKDGDQIVKTAFRPLLKSFLMPDYNLIDVDKYLIHPSKDFFFSRSPAYMSQAKEDDKLAAIMFSRGCVGACGFCYRHLPGFRQASVEWSWEHLKLLYSKYGVRYFRIDDELFINNPEWFRSLYQKVIDSNLDISFRVTGLRVDLINSKLLGMLKEMGCIAINYGIESGSQKILDNMFKMTKVDQNLSALQKTLSQGLQTMAYIILGYEGENKKTLDETLELLLDSNLPSEYACIYYAMPLPGTKLYNDCVASGRIKDEEEFLERLSMFKEDKRHASEFYLINLTENLDISDLADWEWSFKILSKLKQRLRNHLIIFRIFKLVIPSLPAKKQALDGLIKFNNLIKFFRK